MTPLMDIGFTVSIPDVGKRLREARKASGMSPTDVAHAARMGVANLYRIENEKLEVLPYDSLFRLGKVLGIDFESEFNESLIRRAKGVQEESFTRRSAKS